MVGSQLEVVHDIWFGGASRVEIQVVRSVIGRNAKIHANLELLVLTMDLTNYLCSIGIDFYLQMIFSCGPR